MLIQPACAWRALMALALIHFLKIREDFESYKNFIFISVGMVDTGTFKGEEELQNLEENVKVES
jgi:hypothetical protein